MAWFTLLSHLISLALKVINHLERQRAIKEGEARALKDLLETSNVLVQRANRARDDVRDDPDSVVRDDFNRDKGSTGASDPEKPV